MLKFCRDLDVIVCIDGNFQHWRYSSIQDNPEIIELNGRFFFIAPEDVESAKEHVAHQRGINKPSNQQDA
jgi:hypothetical protein